jgi:hypothetical protein
MLLQSKGHGHGHGHGVFISATHPKGKWTSNPNPRSPSIPAQALMTSDVAAVLQSNTWKE